MNHISTFDPTYRIILVRVSLAASAMHTRMWSHRQASCSVQLKSPNTAPPPDQPDWPKWLARILASPTCAWCSATPPFASQWSAPPLLQPVFEDGLAREDPGAAAFIHSSLPEFWSLTTTASLSLEDSLLAVQNSGTSSSHPFLRTRLRHNISTMSPLAVRFLYPF